MGRHGSTGTQGIKVEIEVARSVLLNQNTGVKLAIFAILQVLGPMLSDGRIPQIATLT